MMWILLQRCLDSELRPNRDKILKFNASFCERGWREIKPIIRPNDKQISL